MVEERPGARFLARLSSDRGAHAVWRLTKESLTTPAAVEGLARALGVRPGVVGYAGLKDKHARTSQLVSVPAPELRGPAGAPPRLEARGWSAEFLGWSPEPVGGGGAASMEGNRFTIIVRGLTAARAREMDRRAALLRSGANGSLVVLNYFGAQRFGSARHGKGFAGRRLIEGDFEGALRLLIATPARKDSGKLRALTRACAAKWGRWDELARELPRLPERRAVEALATGASFKGAFGTLPQITQTMAVEAYQSHLWNETARACAAAIVAQDQLLRSDDEFGAMLFPPAAAIDPDWRAVVVPLLARGSVLAPPWAEAADRALESEGIRVDDLRIPGLRRPFFGEALRPLFVEASSFEMSTPVPDGADGAGRSRPLVRTVRFDLPRGSYATVVLRALGE